MVYTLRFFYLRNAVCFIILTYLVPVLFTFYMQGVLKLKKNNSGAKRLILYSENIFRCHMYVFVYNREITLSRNRVICSSSHCTRWVYEQPVHVDTHEWRLNSSERFPIQSGFLNDF